MRREGRAGGDRGPRRSVPDESPDDGKRDEPGHHREQEERSLPARKEEQKEHRDERPERGAGVIHRADVAEGPAADGGLDEVGDQRVAGSAPDPLPESVGRPHGDRAQRRGHEPHQWPDERRKPVAEKDERPAAEPVGHGPRRQPHDRRHGIGKAIDQSNADR